METSSISLFTALAQGFDLSCGALGRIGGDPLQHPKPFLEALDLALQRGILRGERRILARRQLALAPFQRITVPCPYPVVRDPGDRTDGDGGERYQQSHV